MEEDKTVELEDCPDCMGSGIIECYACGQDVDCAECDGGGKIEVES